MCQDTIFRNWTTNSGELWSLEKKNKQTNEVNHRTILTFLETFSRLQLKKESLGTA